MQRGCRLIFVHFHSTPYLDQTSQEKVRQLVRELTRRQFRSLCYLIPFGEIQRQIVAAVARPLQIVFISPDHAPNSREGRVSRKMPSPGYRRKPYSGGVTNLGEYRGDRAAAQLPILRPLVGMDEQEIIDQARRIGTYEISSIPDQDCCQLFVPKHPATKTDLPMSRRMKAGSTSRD